MTKRGNVATKIYVVRHGESESNVYAREYPDKPASHFGELGSSLTPKGVKQAKKLANMLRAVHFDGIFSSDLNRSRETAEIIAHEQNVPVITDASIRERFFGEHMSSNQKKEIEKELETLDDEGKFAFRYFPHGESGYDAIKRFKKFLENILTEYKNKTILIVSHGYIMRSFLIHEGYAKFDELLGGSIKNCGYFVIKTDGKTFEVVDKHGILRRKGVDNEE